MSPDEYLSHVRAALEARRDPQAAVAMRAYLRDQFEFLGLPAPVRRAAVAPFSAGRSPRMAEADLWTCVEALWALPQREYQYVAVDLLARHARGLGLSAVERLLALAQQRPWWETVDGLAGVVGDVLARVRRSDAQAQREMDRALQHPSFWVRRIAMLHQLGWRQETDARRLFDYASTLAPETEFFIRKAIGWALRDYARWEPAAVQDFVAVNRARLSGLTASEALRRLGDPR